MTNTRAGFVAIIGEPNVGKSTLMNAVLGTKLSIVTPKPQTTRKSILGIYTTEPASTATPSSTEGEPMPVQTQIVFYDTPGILQPSYGLHESMMESVRSSIEGADVILLVLDALKLAPQHSTNRPSSKPTKANQRRIEDAAQAALLLRSLTEKLKTTFESLGKPIVVAINKMDALHDAKQILPTMSALLNTGVVKEVFTISALHGKFVSDLVQALSAYMPEHELYYDPELLSEMPQRFFVSEIIREVVFMAYKEEIPYSSEINIAEFKERERGKWYISAEIIVERDTQKGIIIGKNGAKLKDIGQKARIAIEEYVEMPVFLELYVKVREGWRDNHQYLRSFGYGISSR
jgi:GTP-binding protein Era